MRDRRALEVRIANESRLIAAEDAGRYRDALGTGLPLGLPDAFLMSEEPDALASLLRRYARTRGPFTTAELAGRRKRFSVVLALTPAAAQMLTGRCPTSPIAVPRNTGPIPDGWVTLRAEFDAHGRLSVLDA